MMKLTKPKDLPEHLSEIWDEICDSVQSNIGEVGLESLCCQVHRMRCARARIDSEGIVVADSKGNPVPHPALEIEKKSQLEIRIWMKDFKAFD